MLRTTPVLIDFAISDAFSSASRRFRKLPLLDAGHGAMPGDLAAYEFRSLFQMPASPLLTILPAASVPEYRGEYRLITGWPIIPPPRPPRPFDDAAALQRSWLRSSAGEPSGRAARRESLYRLQQVSRDSPVDVTAPRLQPS